MFPRMDGAGQPGMARGPLMLPGIYAGFMKGDRGRRVAAILMAVVMLSTACGSSSSERLETVDTGEEPPLESGELANSQSGSEIPSAGPQPQEVTVPPRPTPQTIEGLVRCEDVPRLGSRVEGNLGPGANADDDVMAVVLAYRKENPEGHGGLWIDRDNGGAIVLAVTDDPEAHRWELQDRLSGLDAVFDVVQVEFTKAELLEIQGRLGQYMGPEFGLLSTSASDSLNRVSLDFYDPPEGALGMFVELVDPTAVCVNVTYSPEPPSGPLALIPDIEAEDPLVTCHGIPPVPYSRFSNPVSIDQVDHPAAEALRTLVQEGGVWELPVGGWLVINIDDDNATFAVFASDGFGSAIFERTSRDNWVIAGWGTGPPCEPVVVLPDGLNRVAIRLDLDALPNPEDRTIHVLATETECASGREMGDALLGPQIIETDEAVLLAFAAISPVGPAECPGNPSTSVTIELSQALGQRTLYDGLYVPPKPITVDSDW